MSFSLTQTIPRTLGEDTTQSGPTPSITLTDTTGSEKDLLIALDADKVNFRDKAGSDGELLALDLTNKRVGIGTESPTIHLAIGGTNTGLNFRAGNALDIHNAGAATVDFQTVHVLIRGDAKLAWSETTDPTASSPTLSLWKDGNDILAQRRTTTSQESRIYNTFTDASNYERVSIGYKNTSNVLRLDSEAAGTGTVRDMALC